MIEYRFTDRPLEKAFKLARQLYDEGRKFIVENGKETMYLFLHEVEHRRVIEKVKKFANYNGKNYLGEHVYWLEFDAIIVYIDVAWNPECFDWEDEVVFVRRDALPYSVIKAIKEYFEGREVSIQVMLDG